MPIEDMPEEESDNPYAAPAPEAEEEAAPEVAAEPSNDVKHWDRTDRGEQSIRASGRLNVDELEQVWKMLTPNRWRSIAISFTVFALLPILPLIPALPVMVEHHPKGIFWVVLILFAWYVVLIWFIRMWMNSPHDTAKSQANQDRGLGAYREHVFNDTYWEIHTPDDVVQRGWRPLTKFQVAGDLVQLELNYGNRTYDFLVRRHFDSDADWQRLLELLGRKVQEYVEVMESKSP